MVLNSLFELFACRVCAHRNMILRAVELEHCDDHGSAELKRNREIQGVKIRLIRKVLPATIHFKSQADNLACKQKDPEERIRDEGFESPFDVLEGAACFVFRPGQDRDNILVVMLPRKDETETQKVLRSLLSGGLSGACAKTLIAPLDRTKIFFQVSHRKFSLSNALRLLRELHQTDGFRNLWRGNSATLIRIIPYAAIQFAVHDKTKRYILSQTNERHLQPLPRFFAGAFAGATSSTLTYPLDLMRARLAVQTGENQVYRGLGHAIALSIRQEGFLSLFHGLLPTLLGIVPYAGTSFFTYESLKILIESYNVANDRPPDVRSLQRLVAGGFAGLVAQTATYPLDVVRRRMQTDGMLSRRAGFGVLGTVRQIWRTEGIRGFYKGVSLNWIKGPVSVAVSFTIYDYVHKNLPL
eukprot:m.628979 g.628979  ORF g.628979 m.628979 type:complete len:412 (+) comp58268_c2_seq1:1598-2833(+)